MNTTIKLETAKFPKAISSLVHSNQFLKIFSIFSSGLTALSLAVVLVALTRPPLILTLSPTAQTLDLGQPPKLEDEVKAAVLKYVELRYKWDPSNVKDHLKAAEAFISPNALTAYQGAANNVARFSQDKQVAQRVYPETVVPNLESRKIVVMGDRITAIQGIRATGVLKLELSFEIGQRSRLNPWGIYVTKELEEN